MKTCISVDKYLMVSDRKAFPWDEAKEDGRWSIQTADLCSTGVLSFHYVVSKWFIANMHIAYANIIIPTI